MKITKEQAITLLRSFSALEGFIFSAEGRSELFDIYIDPSVALLTKIIMEDEQ